MWRLSVEGRYKEKVFQVCKFFLNVQYSFRPGDVLLLQVLKSDEPGTLKRVKGFMVFERLEEDAKGDSVALYGRKWKYVIIPSLVHKFTYDEKFNLSDLLGDQRAKRYDAQSEAVELRPDDSALIENRVSKYLKLE